METNTVTTMGKFRYWQKFLTVLIVGMLLLGAGCFVKNSYLWWGSGITIVFSGWYGILSVFELFEKIDKEDKG